MPDVLISVATYQRPHLLADLLRSLEASRLPDSVRLCIVDNDPAGSAREVAAGSTLPVTYIVEPRVGIAAARNRGLEEVRATDDFIVFVDDDERVSEGWLDSLLRVQSEHRADVVGAPVISVFAPNAPEWIVRGGFIQRPRLPTGAVMITAATNNTLVRLDFLRENGWPRFDEAFSLTGGSDTEFFRGIRDKGAQMVWCDEALVYEDVPTDRATFRWIFRRGVRAGNVHGRLRLRERSRARVALDGGTRIVYGICRQLMWLFLGRGLHAKNLTYVTLGVGYLGASTNRLVMEYARRETGQADAASSDAR